MPPARQHCWVSGPAGNAGPHPGLVLEWQQRDTGWWAHVAYVVEGDAAVVLQWLPPNMLKPVGRQTATPS